MSEAMFLPGFLTGFQDSIFWRSKSCFLFKGLCRPPKTQVQQLCGLRSIRKNSCGFCSRLAVLPDSMGRDSLSGRWLLLAGTPSEVWRAACKRWIVIRVKGTTKRGSCFSHVLLPCWSSWPPHQHLVKVLSCISYFLVWANVTGLRSPFKSEIP